MVLDLPVVGWPWVPHLSWKFVKGQVDWVVYSPLATVQKRVFVVVFFVGLLLVFVGFRWFNQFFEQFLATQPWYLLV